jgi:CRP-like cAMP-binding protein
MIPRRRVDKGTQAVLDLWTELRVDDARAVASSGTPLHLADGTLLTQAGMVGREAFLLLAGTCVVELDGSAVTACAGSVIGEISVLDRHARRNATVVACGDVDVLVYDPPTYSQLAERPALRARLAPARPPSLPVLDLTDSAVRDASPTEPRVMRSVRW